TQSGNDVLRGLGRYEQTDPGRDVEAGNSFGDGGNIRQRRYAVAADRKRGEFSGLHMRQGGGDVVVHELHIAGEHGLGRRPDALVGYVHDVDVRLERKHGQAEVAEVADAAR